MKIVSFYEMAPDALSKVTTPILRVERGAMSSVLAGFFLWLALSAIEQKAPKKLD